MTTTEVTVSVARRWTMLAIGVTAQSASAYLVQGSAFLIPELHAQGLTYAHAGVLVAMPTVGLTLTLILWGAIVDRIGERRVLVAGLSLVAAASFAAAASSGNLLLAVFLFLGGIGAASSNSASGRVVVGWFPAHQRGLAMGIRQTAQPLGVALSACTVPVIAEAHGISAALIIPGVLAAVAAIACYVGVIDPPRPNRADAAHLTKNPYRESSVLWRIHGVSVLLVIPQMTVWTFALVWLTDDRHWPIGAAGALITVTQILGAAGRIAAGAWSDWLHSRLRPLRYVAVAAVATMAALSWFAWQGWGLAVVMMVVASVVTVADNGLAFTAVAEIAGPFWSGRGLGIQNTGQNLTSAAIPPLFGLMITAAGFPAVFLLTAAVAAVAVPLVPRDPGRPDSGH